MQYYMNYVLGLPRSTSKKATQGTIVHKVMEVLAQCKKTMQNLEETPIACDKPTPYRIDDEHIGIIEWFHDDFLKPYPLSNDEIDAINKTRVSKYKYKHDAKIPYGTIHYGQSMVEDIFERCFAYYSQDDWAPVDRKDCVNWTWMALEYKNGIFDPRQRQIIAAEPQFEYVIDKPWANYNWRLPSGEKISGKLGIKGTIDLITEVGEGIIEIVDFKTGQRLDWGSKKDNDIKTYVKLCDDFQLMLYCYAAKRLYPHAKQIIVSIFYIRDGGPYTICMDDTTTQKVEELLQQRFQEISVCNHPQMLDHSQKHFKCTRICDYFKAQSPNGKTNMCRFIYDKIREKGIDWVTDNYTEENFNVGYYQEPGEKE